ncbi:MAG: glycosyltransferase [Actinomycetota bacterium]
MRLRRSWVVLREEKRLRWGGDLRRHFLFASLAERTGARTAHGWSVSAVRAALAPTEGRKPFLAVPDPLGDEALEVATASSIPILFDLMDDFVLQHDALAIPLAPEKRAELQHMRDANLASFRFVVSQTESFARLAGLDPKQTVPGVNGSDTTRILQEPWPARPAIAMTAGAAPGRGIEALIAAARVLRNAGGAIDLLLFLAATGPASEADLSSLKESCAADEWIKIETVTWEELSAALGRATVLCIPHPNNSYWDAIVPVKLPDCMAAGRPVVITPRFESTKIVEGHRCGIVASDDSVEALAEALDRALSGGEESRRMGNAARRAAEEHFDWRVIGDRLADAVLRKMRFRIFW